MEKIFTAMKYFFTENASREKEGRSSFVFLSLRIMKATAAAVQKQAGVSKSISHKEWKHHAENPVVNPTFRIKFSLSSCVTLFSEAAFFRRKKLTRKGRSRIETATIKETIPHWEPMVRGKL